MNFAWYALWFIVAVGLLVTIHEFGHYWVARRLGFKVLRFSVGFGRPLWKRIGAAPDHIEYVIAAIPPWRLRQNARRARGAGRACRGAPLVHP